MITFGTPEQDARHASLGYWLARAVRKQQTDALEAIEVVLRELMPGPAIPLAIIYQDGLPIGIECTGGVALYPQAAGGPAWMAFP